MTIAYVNSGTFAGNNTSSIAPGVPASPASGNRFVAFVGGKPYNSTPGTPTGYTKQASSSSGTTIVGNGTGSTYCVGYDHDVTGSESGTVTFTCSPNGDPAMARIFQFSKSSTATWSVTGTALADTNNAGDNMISATGTMISIAQGDMLVWAATMPNDNDLIGSPSMSVPGCTVDTPTTIASDTTTFGNDGIIFYYYALVTAGASTGAPVFTAVTGPLAGGGTDPDDTAVPLVRLREISSTASGTMASTMGAFTSSVSGNVIDNGTIGSTMGAFTSSLAGNFLNTGSAASTMGGFTSDLEGNFLNTGDAASTLGGFTGAFEGNFLNFGDMASTMGAFGSALDGNFLNTGDAASTMGGFTGSFDGNLLNTGEVASTMGAFSGALDGNLLNTGSMASNMGAFMSSFESSASDTPTGDIASTMGSFTSEFAGALVVEGVIASSMGGFTSDMAGGKPSTSEMACTMGAFRCNLRESNYGVVNIERHVRVVNISAYNREDDINKDTRVSEG